MNETKRPAHKAAPDAPVYRAVTEISAQGPVAKPGEPVPQEFVVSPAKSPETLAEAPPPKKGRA